MKYVKARLTRAASRLGIPGAVGIGFLLFAAGLYHSSIAPAKERLETLRAKITRLPQVPRVAGAPDSAHGPLAGFYAFFPPLSAIPTSLTKVFALAEREGLNIAKSEYRLLRPAQNGVMSYEAVFPLRGTYPQVRRFVLSVLNELPYVSLDDLRLEKQRAEDTVIESQIKLTIYLRAK